MKKIKKAKKIYSFRLSEITKKQIELMSGYDGMSEADIIGYAIEKLYITNYYREMPDKFSEIRNTDYLIP